MAKRKAVPAPPPPSDQWTVTVTSGDQTVTVEFDREASARHYADHALNVGVWIADRFVTDAQVLVAPPSP